MWEEGREYLRLVLEFLSSDGAIKSYIGFSILLILGFALWYAFQQLRFLREVALRDFEKKIPGPKPKKETSIKNQKQKIENFINDKWSFLTRKLCIILIFGFFVPSIILFFGATHYAYFDPTGAPFSDTQTGQIVSDASYLDVFVFVLGQLTRGAVMDFIEVFNIQTGMLTNNSDNYIFSAIVLMFRSFFGIFAAVVAVFAYRACSILIRLKQESPTSPTHQTAHTPAKAI
jgi:hypothetical protein